jgi:hypothetical protein
VNNPIITLVYLIVSAAITIGLWYGLAMLLSAGLLFAGVYIFEHLRESVVVLTAVVMVYLNWREKNN